MFKSERINPYVLRILCPGNVYVYLVEGSQSCVLIDTGLGYGDLKEYISNLTSKPIVVVLTHGHLDHAGGSSSFDEVYLHRDDMEMACLHTKIEVRKGYLEQNGVQVDESKMVKACASYLPLDNNQIFDLGNVSVQVLPMKGHTNGSMAVLIQPCRMVIFGDACNSLAFMQFEDCISIEAYGKELKRFKELYEDLYDTVYYSHPHNYGGKEILDEMIELCNELSEGMIEGVPFYQNVLLAKAIDKNNKRLDGKIANIAYLKSNIK